MVFLAKTSLEYEGETTTIKYVTGKPFVNGELTEAITRKVTPIGYLMNPFDPQEQLLTVDGHVLIIDKKENQDTAVVPDKEGILRNKSNRVVLYKGEFSRGFRHGQGLGAIFSNTRQFIGDYKGNWYFSMRHGYGELAELSGITYCGEWKYDQKSGLGTEVDSIGSKYIGTYQDDVRHGTGRFIWGDGISEDREYNQGILISKTSVDDRKGWEQWNLAKSKLEGWKTNFSKTEKKYSIVDEKAPEAKPLTGLAAKREMKAVQDDLVPRIAKQVSDIIGKTITIDVDWNSFSSTDRSTVCLWMLSTNDGQFTLAVIVKALAHICKDPLGKEGAAAKLSKIVLKNRDKMRELVVTLNGGVLEIVDNFGYEDAKLEQASLCLKIEKFL